MDEKTPEKRRTSFCRMSTWSNTCPPPAPLTHVGRTFCSLAQLVQKRKKAIKAEGEEGSGGGPSSPGGNNTAGDVGGGGRRKLPEITLASFSSLERKQTLEMLLSRERVLSLLYAKTFPLSRVPGPSENGDDAAGSAAGSGGGGGSAGGDGGSAGVAVGGVGGDIGG